MLLEQKERIIKIVEAIDGLPNNTRIKGLLYRPDNMDNIDLPALLILPDPVDITRTDAQGFNAKCSWQLYLYIRKRGVGSSVQSSAEPLVMLDKFMEQFLTRPQLQYNDTALLGIVGNSTFRNTQSLSKPLIYPLNRQGTEYDGAIFNLTLTQRQIYNLNISGA